MRKLLRGCGKRGRHRRCWVRPPGEGADDKIFLASPAARSDYEGRHIPSIANYPYFLRATLVSQRHWEGTACIYNSMAVDRSTIS